MTLIVRSHYEISNSKLRRVMESIVIWGSVPPKNKEHVLPDERTIQNSVWAINFHLSWGTLLFSFTLECRKDMLCE